jgi:hypothetical protein
MAKKALMVPGVNKQSLALVLLTQKMWKCVI